MLEFRWVVDPLLALDSPWPHEVPHQNSEQIQIESLPSWSARNRGNRNRRGLVNICTIISKLESLLSTQHSAAAHIRYSAVHASCYVQNQEVQTVYKTNYFQLYIMEIKPKSMQAWVHCLSYFKILTTNCLANNKYQILAYCKLMIMMQYGRTVSVFQYLSTTSHT